MKTVLFALVVIAVQGCDVKVEEKASSARVPDVLGEPSERVMAHQLARAFGELAPLGDQRFTGKVLDVSGTVQRVEKRAKNYSVLLVSMSHPEGAACLFSLSKGPEVSGLEGRSVRVRGLCRGKVDDAVTVDQARLVETIR